MTLFPAPEPEPLTPALATCDRLLHRSLRAANIVILCTFGIVGGWLAIARLDSAVVAPAVLENANATRQVQHLEGGIVREFFVRNGDKVKQGDLLLKLDPTRNAASAELFQNQLLGSQARQERLEAEASIAPELVFSQAIQQQLAANPSLASLAEDEQRHFALQRKELEQSRELLQTNISQAEAEISANEVRRGIAVREAALVRADLEDQKTLREKGLTSQARVTELEQQSLSLEEKIAQSDIDISRIRQAIIGFKLQSAQLEQEYRRRAAEQLEQITREIRSLERDLTIAEDTLTRVDIVAPVSGTVQESILGTVGAVVRSGETIMKIAPSDDDFILVARVSPNDIDGILPGSGALVNFPAFQSLDLPPAEGELTALSRDRVVDPYTRVDYYEARVRLDADALPEAQRSKLMAGMSATVILPTGKRTALNYLLGPLSRRLQSAMREE